MEKIYSKVDNEKLLHIIVRKEDLTKGRGEVVPENNFIQCAILNMDEGKTFKPHKHIWKERTRNLLSNKTLGVQVRLTDMKKHNHVHGLDLYIKKINELIELYPEIEQIFVSTDDSSVIDILKDSINCKVVYYEDMFRADSLNPHNDPYDRYHSNRQYHKYKLALEGVLEIFTLTKCDYLLTAHVSAFSMVASILSENIKKVFKL